jgi:hypothetical protein
VGSSSSIDLAVALGAAVGRPEASSGSRRRPCLRDRREDEATWNSGFQCPQRTEVARGGLAMGQWQVGMGGWGYLALVEEGAGAGAHLAHDALAGVVVRHHRAVNLLLPQPHEVVALGVGEEALVHEDPRLPRDGLHARRVERRPRRDARRCSVGVGVAEEEHRHHGGGRQEERQDQQHAAEAEAEAEPHGGEWSQENGKIETDQRRCARISSYCRQPPASLRPARRLYTGRDRRALDLTGLKVFLWVPRARYVGGRRGFAVAGVGGGSCARSLVSVSGRGA